MYDLLLIVVTGVLCLGLAVVVLGWHPVPSAHVGEPAECGVSHTVGVGTVQWTVGVAPRAGVAVDLAMVEVETGCGQVFTGRLLHRVGDEVEPVLRPGLVLLVAFDPTARQHLSLPDDIVAVRAAFDQMLLRKGLISGTALDLIRNGTKSSGVVTAMRATGTAREDYREVELDLMVKRPGGGQFPARETALIPASALPKVTPGSVVDTYYRAGDESVVAVCVSPA